MPAVIKIQYEDTSIILTPILKCKGICLECTNKICLII